MFTKIIVLCAGVRGQCRFVKCKFYNYFYGSVYVSRNARKSVAIAQWRDTSADVSRRSMTSDLFGRYHFVSLSHTFRVKLGLRLTFSIGNYATTHCDKFEKCPERNIL